MISLIEIENAYTSHSNEIFSYIRMSVHDMDTAEDILQDVFIRLIKYSVKKNVNADNIRALLYVIARSVVVDFYRKYSKEGYISDDVNSLPDLRDSSDQDIDPVLEAMNILIDSLDEPGRSIMQFRRNGLTYSEISKITGVSERTVKRKVSAIIDGIRKKLKGDGFYINAGTKSIAGTLNSIKGNDDE